MVHDLSIPFRKTIASLFKKNMFMCAGIIRKRRYRKISVNGVKWQFAFRHLRAKAITFPLCYENMADAASGENKRGKKDDSRKNSKIHFALASIFFFFRTRKKKKFLNKNEMEMIYFHFIIILKLPDKK